MTSYWIKLYTEFVNDPKMRRLTLEQRGLWISILCLAGQSPRFGSLYLSEKIPYTIPDIVDAVGIRGDVKRVNEFVTNSLNQFDLLDMIQHDERGGIMIKNFAKRQGSEHPAMVRERVMRHRLKQNGNGDVTAVTGLDIDKDIDKDKDSLFEQFWLAYPNKKEKKKAREKYMRIVAKKPGLHPTIMAALEAQKKSPQWTKDGGRYVPHPTTWLNGERWNDEVEVAKSKNDKYAKIGTNTTTVRG